MYKLYQLYRTTINGAIWFTISKFSPEATSPGNVFEKVCELGEYFTTECEMLAVEKALEDTGGNAVNFLPSTITYESEPQQEEA